MKPTTEILANMSRNSSAHHDEVFTRVYRYLLRPDLYFAAYKRLQANNGADTRGVNDDTAEAIYEPVFPTSRMDFVPTAAVILRFGK